MAERSVASVPDFTSDERLRAGSADPSGARDPLPPPFNKTTTQESGLRENCTSRLSERAEAGRKPHLSRLYRDEGSVMGLDRRGCVVRPCNWGQTAMGGAPAVG